MKRRNRDRTKLLGNRYGKVVIIAFSGVDKYQHSMWVYRCDCGNVKVTQVSSLKSNRTTSCGCGTTYLRAKRGNNPHRKSSHELYNTWGLMLSRCANPKATSWKYYGARGITVCGRWHNFNNFLEDMGERPRGMTLDRKDADGNYEPSNCRWATAQEQTDNRRKVVNNAKA